MCLENWSKTFPNRIKTIQKAECVSVACHFKLYRTYILVCKISLLLESAFLAVKKVHWNRESNGFNCASSTYHIHMFIHTEIRK